MPSFGTRSEKQLATCHPELQLLLRRVVESWDCTVIEGKRSEEDQQFNVDTGASRTLNSKHVYPLGVPSLAVDVTPYPIRWNDLSRLYAFAGFVIGTAREMLRHGEMTMRVRWGGDWDSDRDFHDQTFNDTDHFELVVP